MVQWILLFFEHAAQLWKYKKEYKTTRCLLVTWRGSLFCKSHSLFGLAKKLATSWSSSQMCGRLIHWECKSMNAFLKNELGAICANSPSYRGFYFAGRNSIPSLVFKIQSETYNIFPAHCGFNSSSKLCELWAAK